MKNNKGFTLIEMLVVVALIAILTISAGVGTNIMTKKTKISTYKRYYEKIFSAAKVYSSLSSKRDLCTYGCEITLKDLYNKGLIDDIFLSDNPLKSTGKFLQTDKVNVYYLDGVKHVRYTCGSGIVISDENIVDGFTEYENWGVC